MYTTYKFCARHLGNPSLTVSGPQKSSTWTTGALWGPGSVPKKSNSDIWLGFRVSLLNKMAGKRNMHSTKYETSIKWWTASPHWFSCYLCQLGLVESRSGLQLVVSLVASQRVHLQLEKIDLNTQQTQKRSQSVTFDICNFSSILKTFQWFPADSQRTSLWRNWVIAAIKTKKHN